MAAYHIIRKDSIASTNDYIKLLLKEADLPERTVVITDVQSNGRGQGTNQWESQPNKNLTYSLLLKPSFVEASEMFIISKVISLGIVDYLSSLGKGFSIKWPNDIYWNNKKICGILIENQLLGCCINYSTIGIGLNINQEEFLSDAPNPVSLKQIFGKDFSIDSVLDKLLKSIENWYNTLSKQKLDLINETYFSYLYRTNGFYTYTAGYETFDAQIESVENDGLLKLRTTEGELKSFYFKEVDFIID